MRIGALRQRIDIEQPVITQDAYGSQLIVWSLFAASVPAEVVPLSGREFLAADEKQSEVSARVKIRNLVGLNSRMRLKFDGETYRISAVLPDPSARNHLNIMISKGVNDAD